MYCSPAVDTSIHFFRLYLNSVKTVLDDIKKKIQLCKHKSGEAIPSFNVGMSSLAISVNLLFSH